MKGWLRKIVLLLSAIGVVVVLVMALQKEKQLIVNPPIIDLEIQDGMALLTEEELLGHLKFARLFYEDMRVEELDIEAVEEYVNALNEVEFAEVYKLIGKDWHIRARIRRPIARIIPDRQDGFYMDNRGKLMALTSSYHARVLTFTGLSEFNTAEVLKADVINNDSLITNTKLGEIYRISNYVCSNAFYNSQIVQVHYLPSDGFVLIPRVGGHEIIFGRAPSDEAVEAKFEKLTTFYNEVIPFEGWDKYSSINLKFEKQIVAKKK
jgi:cell division protein FtsQ